MFAGDSDARSLIFTITPDTEKTFKYNIFIAPLKRLICSRSFIDFSLCSLRRKQARRNYTVSQKNCAKLFLSELCQISANFETF